MSSETQRVTDAKFPGGHPLVSVVIPAYNGRELIVRTIESILAQTWPAVEVIVVDDGSTDGTSEVVARFGDRVRFFQQKNSEPIRTLDQIDEYPPHLMPRLTNAEISKAQHCHRYQYALDAKQDFELISEMF